MLTVVQDTMAVIERQACQGYPGECCGVLLGSSKVSCREVIRAEIATNLQDKRRIDRYEISPLDYLRIETIAKQEQLEIVGIYHSHPNHPAKPSETDRQRALDVWGSRKSWSYLILEIRNGEVKDRRSWILQDQEFHPEKLEVIPLQRRKKAQ